MMIFLSYVREDRARVQEVYAAMRDAGLTPWMDAPPEPYLSDGIPPGVEWDTFIRNKIREARVTLAFISNASIARSGYVQREYRLALSVAMEATQAHTPLIPVRLEECSIPEIRVDTISLTQLQWYDLFSGGLDPLIDHLITLKKSDKQPADQQSNAHNPAAIAIANEYEYRIKQLMKYIERLEIERSNARNEAAEMYADHIMARELNRRYDY